MIANECGPDNKIGKILPILNELPVDAFFIKVLVLDITSLSGERMPISGDQLSNPGLSLQLPYIYLGLGRTNSYVEQLIVSLNRKIQYLLIYRMESNLASGPQLFLIPNS